MAQLFLYNTLTRSKDPFHPIHAGKVGLYTCGPTVYHYAHLGNLRTYVFEDILKRVLRYNKLVVKHVMNITDVGHLTSDADSGEDKMEKGAKREGKSVWDVANFYTDAFKLDLDRLNVDFPLESDDHNIWCKATDHIPEQIAQIRALEKNGFTYAIEDGVYFDTAKLDDYGKLARLNIEELKAGARIEVAEGKRNPTDFALWKFSPKGEQRAMEWIFDGERSGELVTNELRSTLSEKEETTRGFPGWHIECSAMAEKYLGNHFDIHCGGIDHIPVHHTNEIAQAEGAGAKKPWVNVWMHGEFLVIDKGKMAKSGENFLTLQTLIDKDYDPLVYRFFCLSATYSQQLSFSWESIDGAKNSYDSLKSKIRDLRENPTEGADTHSATAQAHKDAFLTSVNDDLNMPQALAALWAMVRDSALSTDARLALADDFDSVLGLKLLAEEEAVPEYILALATQRDEARATKDWKRSDELRDEIQKDGFIVEDTKQGTKVRKA